MSKHIRCGTLFTGLDDKARKDHTVVIDGGEVSYVGPTAKAPVAGPEDEAVDYSRYFVMPGLIDAHTHLSYGNALSEEAIDLYAPVEFRALRGMWAAQKVLRAGCTSVADPAATGNVCTAIRDAIIAGLFVGPRLTVSGRQISSRQSIGDFYPEWSVGVPDTSVGVLVRNRDQAVDEVRRQVKAGVDLIKIGADGDTSNPYTGIAAAFTQVEMSAMVDEAHRLGRKVVTHSRGAESVLVCARAGVDVIFHASWMDDEGLEAVLENNCAILPTLTLLVNNTEFTRPTDACFSWWPDLHRKEFDSAVERLAKARKAGVPFLVGTDSGFAVTPYGEWHARELEIFVTHLNFTPSEALRSAIGVNATILRDGQKLGGLAEGRHADILAIDGNPLEDITVLQDRSRIKHILLGGKAVELSINDDVQRLASESAYNLWSEVYTQDRIRQLSAAPAPEPGTRQASAAHDDQPARKRARLVPIRGKSAGR